MPIVEELFQSFAAISIDRWIGLLGILAAFFAAWFF